MAASRKMSVCWTERLWHEGQVRAYGSCVERVVVVVKWSDDDDDDDSDDDDEEKKMKNKVRRKRRKIFFFSLSLHTLS